MSSHLIPATLLRRLGPAARMSNEETIIAYLTSEEGAVVLTDQQQKLLERWNFCDEQMRAQRLSTKEIVMLLAKRFGIGHSQGWKDIQSARTVYGSTIKPHRGYLMALHLDRIEDAIKLATTLGKLELLPKLFDSYTSATKLMPASEGKVPAPTAILFNLPPEAYEMLAQQSGKDPEAYAAQWLAKKGINAEDIDHEEVADA